MSMNSFTITAIPAFTDNYIWLIRGSGQACAIVDPGDHRPVLKVLEKDGLELSHILLTHHHADHIGGVPALLEKFPARVTGPQDTRIGAQAATVIEGDRVALPELGMEFEVIEVPGHTRSHIAFHGHGVLFCGDTLFSIGCGRLFEGTPGQMQESLDKLAALPPATRVYCAHEYTQSNCAFALEVEPENQELRARARQVANARSQGEITIPSTMAEELAANPFLRTRQDPVVAAARKLDPQAAPGAATMAVIRAWKDRF
jgi:hydroxyacylglutathione hydrolase